VVTPVRHAAASRKIRVKKSLVKVNRRRAAALSGREAGEPLMIDLIAM
jgi:hypothetical protein